jgi:hypothetical protein
LEKGAEEEERFSASLNPPKIFIDVYGREPSLKMMYI